METKKTNTPRQRFSPEELKLKKSSREELALSLYDGLQQTKSQRAIRDQTLDYWNDMVEMNVAPRDEPWPNAKSLCVPIVAMMMEQVDGRLANTVYVPRLYVVNALSPDAADSVHEVENWYNDEFRRRRWILEHLDGQMLALRDGVSYMEVLWEHRVTERNVIVRDMWTGKKEVQKAKFVEYHGVKLCPVEARDLFLVPATARNPDSAESVYRALYLSESDLWEMVASETFDKEAVEEVIALHSTGRNDLASDDAGTATYEQGGTLQVGDTGSYAPENEEGESMGQAGIFKVWRVHTKKYDLDDDDYFEENVLFLYDQQPIYMGGGPYEYWHGKRPFPRCTPMPRPLRNDGFSIPERLRGYQEEANARSNQRGDAMDIKLSPPMYRVRNASPVDKDMAFGPSAMWDVDHKDDIGIIDLGSIDPSSWQDEAQSYRYAAVMAGIEAPTMPISGSSKIPTKQQQANQIATNVRLDRMALQIRLWMEDILWQVHQLNLQYGDDEQENDLNGTGIVTLSTDPHTGKVKQHQISYAALAREYVFGVAGANGALDQDSERKDALQLYAMLLQNPLIQGNLKKIHAVTSHTLNKFNLPDITRFIGTIEEAQQQQEQQAQAQQKAHQEEMQLQMMAHAAKGDAKMPPPAQPGQPPQPQPPMGQPH